jgi:sortase A
MLAIPGSKQPRRIVIIVGMVGFALAAMLVFHLTSRSSGQSSSTSGTNPTAIFKKQKKVGLPARLKIPKIKVDVPVEQVGITAKGEMDVPKGPSSAGWYERGPRPGEKGSSVITAHYGWNGEKAAAFDDLYKLRKGDKFYVKDKKGTTITFVVQGTQRYDPKADASVVFRSNDGLAHLNLVTCEGNWDKDQKSYSSRLVVFADKEKDT